MDLRLPRRHGHYVFGVLQSGLTCLIAAGIASYSMSPKGAFLRDWLFAWLTAWATMIPVVLLAAPVIRSIVQHITRE